MKPTDKDELVNNIVKLEGLINGSEYRKEIEFYFRNIISHLFSNDGYQPIIMPHTGDQGIDFLCTKNNSNEKVGVSFKRNKNKVTIEQIEYLTGFAFHLPYNRVIMFGTGGFTSECYQLINKIGRTASIELLDLNDIKNWVSRIETETDLKDLDYENIIKVLSNTFIEKIAADSEFLLKIEWRELEKTLAEIFEGLAFEVKLTPPSKDGGKDLILEMMKEGATITYIVEIKHWRSMQKVGQNSVKDFIKVICNEKREKGVILSTYGFTENAFEGLTELERTKVRYGDEEKIVSLCKTYLRVKSGIWTPLQDLQELLFEQTK